jgi:hypothetical protein
MISLEHNLLQHGTSLKKRKKNRILPVEVLMGDLRLIWMEAMKVTILWDMR